MADPTRDRSTIFIENELLNLLLRGTVSNEDAKPRNLSLLVEEDGTLRTHGLQIYEDPNGNEILAITEADGTPRISNYYYDFMSGALTPIFGSHLVNNGTSLTNVANTVVWNPGGTVNQVWEFRIDIVNVHTTSVVINAGIDVAGGGARGTGESIIYNEDLHYPGRTGWSETYTMAGDDDLMAWCSVNGGADIQIVARRIR